MTTRRPSGAVAALIMAALCVYFLLPFWWLLAASSKDTGRLFHSATLWFGSPGAFFDNLSALFSRDDHIFLKWLENTAVYSVTAGIGATVVATCAGYGFAKYRFPGRDALFSSLLGAVMVPATALVIPTYLLMSKLSLTDTAWAVILPSLLNPFGVYLIRVYVTDALPEELLEAARIDGAGEWKVFSTVAVPVIRPAIVTVLLFSMVGTWNNFFLPLVMLNSSDKFPLTVGLQTWYEGASVQSGADVLFNLVIVGSLVAVVPLVVAFLFLQRYWRGGLTVGALK
ncbi:MAG: carbohydrate ABC transporter permease [Catenulispora sp.]|nr:carbohydrate ABC transporter permease [Catenulispora sp.]